MAECGWRVLAASVAGSHHVALGRDCEDAYQTFCDHDTLILAVADGGTRAPLSGLGSRVAVQVGVEVIKERLHMLTDVRSGMAMLRESVEEIALRFTKVAGLVAAELAEQDVRALGATLAVAVVVPPWLGLLSIGDCFAVVGTEESDFHILLANPPEGGDLGVTTFVNSPDAVARSSRFVFLLPELTSIALSTDGLESAVLHWEARPSQPYKQPKRPSAPFFGHVVDLARDEAAGERALVSVLAGKEVEAATADDRTLVVAVRQCP